MEDIGEMARGSSRRIWEGVSRLIVSENSSVCSSSSRFRSSHASFRLQHPKFSLPSSSSSSDNSHSEKITHISAHFETFFAYAAGSSSDDFATSVVLKGKQSQLRSEDADATGAEPEVIPELQGKGVIKVAVGDYHFAALTAKGKLLT